jgi:hypothetical protein
MVGDKHMAVVVANIDPPAIVEQVRYRHRYYKARRRGKAAQEPGVSPWWENVIPIEEEVPTDKGPVVFIVKPIVNPDTFEERWEARGVGKGDRLR